MQVYIKAKSKRDLNERIAAGQEILAKQYGVTDILLLPLEALPNGAVIKLYSKMVGQNPAATSYGTWNATTRCVK